MKLFSPFDVLPLSALFCVCFLFLSYDNRKDDCFEICFDGGSVEFALSKDTSVTVNFVEIELKNQTARIVKSSCPNQICVATPALDCDGQIVCVPNRVIVSLHRKNTEIDVYVH